MYLLSVNYIFRKWKFPFYTQSIAGHTVVKNIFYNISKQLETLLMLFHITKKYSTNKNMSFHKLPNGK